MPDLLPVFSTTAPALPLLVAAKADYLRWQLAPTPAAGGNDVFVDVGNKSLGLEALMNYLGYNPSEV